MNTNNEISITNERFYFAEKPKLPFRIDFVLKRVRTLLLAAARLTLAT